MGRIQANTGLVTGIDIQGTVDKLMALQAKPRDTANARLTAIKGQQAAVSDVMASVIAIQLAARNVGKTALFDQTTTTSSNTALLTSSVAPGGTPTPGNYLITPVRQAQAQQYLSQGFASTTTALGAGTVILSKGSTLDPDRGLADLNRGAGVVRGKIRITDRSGASEVVDLRFAHTVEDVLTAINASEQINVRAVAEGDRIRLLDNTGLAVSNLRVQEVSGGTTAASLGLAAIDINAATAVSTDLLQLYNGLSLSQLNDGTGVGFHASLADMRVTLKDGTSLDVDFKKVAKAAASAKATVDSANGINADLTFTAKTAGSEYDGVTIVFTDTGTPTKGTETVAYDSVAKTLTFNIDAGATTADDVVATVNRTPAVAALFSAARGTGGNGTGFVALSDTAATSGGAAIPAGNENTMADLLATINAIAPAKLKAEISADGDRIVLTDLTGGLGSLGVVSLNDSSVAEDLGLATTTAGTTLGGKRLLGGLQTTLLRSLNGGQGLGTLGVLALTARNGATANVDLSAAQTVDDVLVAINNAGLGLRAQLSPSKAGISIVDTTGATTSNLVVANGDATNTATKLRLAVNAPTNAQQGASLHRQMLSEQTTLETFNHGKGVPLGSFTITDSSGAVGAVNLKTAGAKTIGDVVEAINGLSVGVRARINDTGDGLMLIDTAGGAGSLTVADSSLGTAASLKIAGESKATTLNGLPAKVIDGSTALKVTLDADDTLADLVIKINSLNGGIKASVFSDGSATPHRLSLISSATGERNQWQIEANGPNLSLEEIVAAQDALVAIGPVGASGPSLLMAGDTNVIDNGVPGVRVTLLGASNEAVTVTVKQDVASISSRVKAFVDAYNGLQTKLEKYDFYNADTDARGILTGNGEILRVRSDLSRALSGRFRVAGTLQSLEAVGVTFKDDGELEFASAKFETAYAGNPTGVETLFTDATSGFGKKLDATVERLAGVENSALINRTIALQEQAEQLTERVARMNLALESSKERLLLQFYRLEESIAKIQNTFGAVASSLSNAANFYNTLT
jgi:flagellar capping protein FliD